MKLFEALKYYKSGISHLDKVLESRWNAYKKDKGTLPEDVVQEADRRYSICESCPFMSLHAKTSPEFLELTGKHLETDRPDSEPFCGICLCPLEYKVLAMSEMCGIGYWNNQHPDRAIQPKWLAYQPNV